MTGGSRKAQARFGGGKSDGGLVATKMCQDGLLKEVEDVAALAGAGLNDGDDSLDEAFTALGLGPAGGTATANEMVQVLLRLVVHRL